MTAQISDTISIHNQEFSIVGVNGGELFTPQSLGIYPIGIMSSCWQGYVCHYKISESRLLLDQLRLTLGIYEGSGKERKFVAQTSPEINGIKPRLPAGQWVIFNNVYEELNLELRFSGGLLAGADFY